jgi:phosphoribosylamine--glycine ligase
MSKINVAVIGSGGREHALSWKLKQSNLADNVFTLPGNGGIENSINIGVNDFPSIREFCETNQIELIVVGPEVPLAEGISDYFKDTNIKIFGPEKAAARLEGSKAYAKEFMRKYDVATAKYSKAVGIENARAVAREYDMCVFKYDGLAAGKGVYVCNSKDEIERALDDISTVYGDDATIIIEELLIGDEISIIGITDGDSIKLLSASQDHKQALDGDKGPNTGGMGAFTPVPFADKKLLDEIYRKIILPTLAGIKNEPYSFIGVVYFGIMITREGPKLLEYNVRFGDPETEVILPALKSDLLEVILSCFDGTLKLKSMAYNEGAYVDVVLASGGYPGKYEKGKVITGTDSLHSDTLLFHAGTELKSGDLVTSGGRVLNVVSKAATVDEAIEKVYSEVEKVQFDGKYYRKDIGKRKKIV